MAIRILGDVFDGRGDARLTRRNGATCVTFNAVTTFRDLVFRLGAPLIQVVLQRRIERDLGHLRLWRSRPPGGAVRAIGDPCESVPDGG